MMVKLQSLGLIIEGKDKESPTKVGLKLKEWKLNLSGFIWVKGHVNILMSRTCMNKDDSYVYLFISFHIWIFAFFFFFFRFAYLYTLHNPSKEKNQKILKALT